MLRVLNYAAGLFFVVLLVASLPFAGVLEAKLVAKYGSQADIASAVMAMRLIVLVGLAGVYAVDRLFSALSAMVNTVRVGDPFVSANAHRLTTIGWALLALQLLDLLGGVASWWFAAHGIDYLDWTPSFTGWMAVLVAFVLARVFTAGAAMRSDLEGTV